MEDIKKPSPSPMLSSASANSNSNNNNNNCNSNSNNIIVKTSSSHPITTPSSLILQTSGGGHHNLNLQKKEADCNINLPASTPSSTSAAKADQNISNPNFTSIHDDYDYDVNHDVYDGSRKFSLDTQKLDDTNLAAKLTAKTTLSINNEPSDATAAAKSSDFHDIDIETSTSDDKFIKRKELNILKLYTKKSFSSTPASTTTTTTPAAKANPSPGRKTSLLVGRLTPKSLRKKSSPPKLFSLNTYSPSVLPKVPYSLVSSHPAQSSSDKSTTTKLDKQQEQPTAKQQLPSTTGGVVQVVSLQSPAVATSSAQRLSIPSPKTAANNVNFDEEKSSVTGPSSLTLTNSSQSIQTENVNNTNNKTMTTTTLQNLRNKSSPSFSRTYDTSSTLFDSGTETKFNKSAAIRATFVQKTRLTPLKTPEFPHTIPLSTNNKSGGFVCSKSDGDEKVIRKVFNKSPILINEGESDDRNNNNKQQEQEPIILPDNPDNNYKLVIEPLSNSDHPSPTRSKQRSGGLNAEDLCGYQGSDEASTPISIKKMSKRKSPTIPVNGERLDTTMECDFTDGISPVPNLTSARTTTSEPHDALSQRLSSSVSSTRPSLSPQSSICSYADDTASIASVKKLEAELQLENQEKIQAASLGLRLLEENSGLKDRCEQLEIDLAAAERANARLREELRHIDASLYEEEAYNSSREENMYEEINGLKNKLSQTVKNLENVTNERDYLLRCLDDSKSEFKHLSGALKSVRQALRAAHAKKQKLTKEKHVLQKTIGDLRNKSLLFNHRQPEMESLRRQVKLVTRENSTLLRLAHQYRSNSECSLNQLHDPFEKMHELDQHRNSLEFGGSSSRTKSTSTLAGIILDRDQQEIDRLKEILEDLKAEVETLREEKQEREAWGHWMRSQSLAIELDDAQWNAGCSDDGLGDSDAAAAKSVPSANHFPHNQEIPDDEQDQQLPLACLPAKDLPLMSSKTTETPLFECSNQDDLIMVGIEVILHPIRILWRFLNVIASILHLKSSTTNIDINNSKNTSATTTGNNITTKTAAAVQLTLNRDNNNSKEKAH